MRAMSAHSFNYETNTVTKVFFDPINIDGRAELALAKHFLNQPHASVVKIISAGDDRYEMEMITPLNNFLEAVPVSRRDFLSIRLKASFANTNLMMGLGLTGRTFGYHPSDPGRMLLFCLNEFTCEKQQVEIVNPIITNQDIHPQMMGVFGFSLSKRNMEKREDGCPTCIEIRETTIIKKFIPILPNHQHLLDEELRIARVIMDKSLHLSIPVVQVLEVTNDRIVMEKLGMSLHDLFNTHCMSGECEAELVEWIDRCQDKFHEEFGVFHDGVHPGNLCFRGKELVWIDFGKMADIKPVFDEMMFENQGSEIIDSLF